MLETSNDTVATNNHEQRRSNETTEMKSSFSCANRADGYYESEWCNIFYRCVAGKRMDE
ncbi:unnamed protein product, partial [Rotaria socialis]